MRPGPTLEVLSRPLRWGMRMDIKYGTEWVRDVPCSGCSLDWGELTHSGTSASAPAQLRIGVPNEWAPQWEGAYYAAYGQKACPTVILSDEEGHSWEFPYGHFRIVEPSQTPESSPVTAKDLLHDLVENPLPWPHSPNPGGTLRTEMQRLNPNWETTAVRVPEPRGGYQIPSTLQLPTDRLVSVMEIAKAAGCGLRMSWRGEIEAYPLPTPGSAAGEYYSWDSGFVVAAVPAEAPSGRIPNQYNVLAKGNGKRSFTLVQGKGYTESLKTDEKTSEVDMAINNRFLEKQRVFPSLPRQEFEHQEGLTYNWGRYLWTPWKRPEGGSKKDGWETDYSFDFWVRMQYWGGWYNPRTYGRVTKNTDLSSDKSWSKVVEDANHWAKFGRDRTRTWRIQLAPDPRLEVGDVIAVEHKPGHWCVVQILSMSLDLMKPGEPMTITGAELRRS